MKNKRERKRKQKEFLDLLKQLKLGKMVSTVEDWCPNFPNNECSVQLGIIYYSGNFIVRISVFGMDDTIMAKECKTDNIYDAVLFYSIYKKEIYDKLEENITFEQLLKMGFEFY